MFTSKKSNFVNIDNKLYCLINNRWAWVLDWKYNSNDTVTVYSIQFI